MPGACGPNQTGQRQPGFYMRVIDVIRIVETDEVMMHDRPKDGERDGGQEQGNEGRMRGQPREPGSSSRLALGIQRCYLGRLAHGFGSLFGYVSANSA